MVGRDKSCHQLKLTAMTQRTTITKCIQKCQKCGKGDPLTSLYITLHYNKVGMTLLLLRIIKTPGATDSFGSFTSLHILQREDKTQLYLCWAVFPMFFRFLSCSPFFSSVSQFVCFSDFSWGMVIWKGRDKCFS